MEKAPFLPVGRTKVALFRDPLEKASCSTGKAGPLRPDGAMEVQPTESCPEGALSGFLPQGLVLAGKAEIPYL